MPVLGQLVNSLAFYRQIIVSCCCMFNPVQVLTYFDADFVFFSIVSFIFNSQEALEQAGL